jgi:hypothetical protein
VVQDLKNRLDKSNGKHMLTISHLLDDLLALCSCDAYELSVDSKCLITCC